MEEAKIQITVKEYEGLKEKIQSLEKVLVKQSNTIDELNAKLEPYEDSIEFLINEMTLFERVFLWKRVKEAVKDDLNLK